MLLPNCMEMLGGITKGENYRKAHLEVCYWQDERNFKSKKWPVWQKSHPSTEPCADWSIKKIDSDYPTIRRLDMLFDPKGPIRDVPEFRRYAFALVNRAENSRGIVGDLAVIAGCLGSNTRYLRPQLIDLRLPDGAPKKEMPAVASTRTLKEPRAGVVPNPVNVGTDDCKGLRKSFIVELEPPCNV